MTELDNNFTTKTYSPLPDLIIDLLAALHRVGNNLTLLPEEHKSVWSQIILGNMVTGSPKTVLDLRLAQYSKFARKGQVEIPITQELSTPDIDDYIIEL